MASFFSPANIGLLFNTLGTLFIAFSIGKLTNDSGGSTAVAGKEYHFAYVKRPRLFQIGLGFIILGFLLQLKF